ncbi:MAG TPA: hypothetical protein VJL29_06170 [Thermoguttaceae bacterium]|nr:hypothetical protein [Thermoguttaceae bacterium]
MDTKVLVDVDISQGERLLHALDEAGIVIRSALWFYLEESAEWRLILATPLVNVHGPKKAYEKVQEVLKSLEAKGEPLDIHLWQISLVSPEDTLVKHLRGAVKAEGISRVRVSGSSVNGLYVDDALVYRLT